MKALLGGTFNPVHNGHIAVALSVLETFQLERVELVPSFQPVHRDRPQTSAEQRCAMLELALSDHPQLLLNRIEIDRAGPSYTVDTLEQLKTDAPETALCWLMGVDAFNGFADWKQPERILHLANLIVCARPGTELCSNHFSSHILGADERLADYPAGRIALHAMPPNRCSSTEVRQKLQQGESVHECLPPAVVNFAQLHHLYEN